MNLTRVAPEGRQSIVRCPRCHRQVALWLNLMEGEEAKAWRESEGYVDITAAIVEPKDRLAAMNRSAEVANMASMVPWIQCVACGYDGKYTFGAPQ